MRAALLAAITPLVLFPSAALAQQTCEQRSVSGSVGGAVAGALLGGAVAGKDDRVAGAAIGGVAGALLGKQLSKNNNCNKAYGYYDDGGRWHASGVQQAQAQGYYDRDGRWVAGQPRGYYDDRGVWIAIDNDHGYYDDSGRWVPPGVNGYYDTGNRWKAVDRGRGGRDDWNDNRWTRTGWGGSDVRERADWLQERISRAENNGRLSRREARSFMNELQDIKADEARMPRRRGELNYRDEQIIEARLDELSSDLRAEMRG